MHQAKQDLVMLLKLVDILTAGQPGELSERTVTRCQSPSTSEG